MLAALVLAGNATGASSARLLAKYQPVTYFAPGEAFRPTTVQSFVTDSTLERFVQQARTWVPIDPAPTVESLPTAGAGWRLNQRTCTPADGVPGAVCYAAAWSGHEAPGTVYGRVVRLASRTVLQYWFFYYDDFYPYNPLVPDFIWQAHEGDWEVVNVVLSRADDEPLEVGYSQHCLGRTRAWSETRRWRGHHPVVFVALGSHANYFSPGTHQFDQRCIPSQALAVLAQLGLPLPDDHASAGALAGPPSLEAEEIEIETISDGSPTWVSFPGTWGEFQYFHAPLVGTALFGFSPVGPAQHDVWVYPLGTLAGWTPG